MTTANTVGSAPLSLSIVYLDQNGAPLHTQPTPDSPPAWTNTAPTSESLTVAADALSATLAAVTPGTDEVDLTVVVGGVEFKAALPVTVVPAPQVLTSVQIKVN